MKSSISPENKHIFDNSANALSQMQTHQILPIPENYHLWYMHAGNYDLSLSKAIDMLISENTVFDENVSKQLYQKFFSNDSERIAIEKTSNGFKSEITKIASILKDASKDTSDHSINLSEQMDKIADFEGSQELKDIVGLVMKDMDTISAQSKKLEKQLEESTGKIDGLKSNLENARIESRTDALTKIGNRKYFDEKITDLAKTANAKDEDFCVIISDIDFFKKFNDTFGHQVGDQVLKVVAHVLKGATSALGMPYRYGGEEFVILVPNSKLHEASILAQHIKNTISTKSIKNKNTGQDFGKITMSFGVAQYTKNESVEAIIQRADAALYLAKENGRNRVQDETDLNRQNQTRHAQAS